jgi:penicillin-binding protein 1A
MCYNNLNMATIIDILSRRKIMVEKRTETEKKKKKKRSGVLKIILFAIISIIVLATVACAGVVLAIIETAPKIDVNAILSLNEPSKIFDDKDVFMDNVITDEQRTIVPFRDIPQDLKNAFVGIEDERFYKHKGIDLRRIAGVIIKDIDAKLRRKPGLQGASTITQQLIRNTLLTQEVTFKRKIQEMYLALQLEKYLTKDQILEAYMNTIFLGGNAYGIEAASNQYFNKPSSKLTLTECAFIAGIPQSPSVSYQSAYRKKDPSFFINRTKTVLDKMYENNYITKEQHDKSISDLNKDSLIYTGLKVLDAKKDSTQKIRDEAVKKKDNASIKKADAELLSLNQDISKSEASLIVSFKQASTNSNRLNYEWFSIPALDAVKKDLKTQYNYTEDEVEHLLMYGGLKIYTTMNKHLQDYAQEVLDSDGNLTSISSKDKNNILQPQASAVVMDYHSGDVKVIIGGRGPQPARSFNRAATNNFLRPSGSSIKPLTVYSPAIDTQKATAATVIEDSPLPEEIGKLYTDNGKPYNPTNYDSEGFKGYINLRSALTYSINLVAIKLEHQLGLKTGAEYAEKFGLKLDNHDKTSIAALALGQLHVNTSGSNPSGVNTLTMAAAYGTFGNEGNYTSPILYRKVVDRSGKVILESKHDAHIVLSPQSAFIMYDMLKGPIENPYGTAPNAKFSSMPAAGKTGTSGDKKDFWFCGLTPYYSGSVWIGNDYPTSYYNVFSSTSAGLWAKIMEEAHKELPVKDIDEPSGIVNMAVCRDSGELPTDLCTKDPRGDRTYTEMFIQGTVPTDMCATHVEAKVNKITGKLASPFTLPFLTESKVFIKRDYTPSVYLDDEPYVLPTELDETKPPSQSDDTKNIPDVDNIEGDNPKNNEENNEDDNADSIDTANNNKGNKNSSNDLSKNNGNIDSNKHR